MRVLMMGPEAAVHTQRPLNWLLESGCHVTFLGPKDPAPSTAGRYRFVPYPVPRGTRYYSLVADGAARRLKEWSIIAQLHMLWRWLAPDVVHVHWLNKRAYDCAMARVRPLVISVWGSDVNALVRPGADPESQRIAGRALARADLVLVDAPDMPEKCARLAGRRVRTELLPLGINTSRFRPSDAETSARWRSEASIPDGAKVLMSHRAFSENYGHHLILEAFARGLPNLRIPTYLVFKLYNSANYADSSTYEAMVRRRADELGVADRVRWVGEVPYEQLPELYAMADVVLNFPTLDAFPVTFLEAAACERAVITNRLPAYRGTFVERFFLTVNPGDVDELAGAIVRQVNDGPVGPHDLEQARDLVVREFDESMTARRLIGIYRRLSPRRRRAHCRV